MSYIPDIRFSMFDGVQAIHPRQVVLSLQQAADFFTPHEIRKVKKEERKHLFSMVLYKEGTTRKKENILEMTGAVFDFDNKDDFVPIETVLQRLIDGNFIHYWYTTWSHTPDRPKWRLVIPFGLPLEPQEWKDVYLQLFVLLGCPPGIDEAAVKDAAHMWFIPYQNPDYSFTGNSSREGWLLYPLDIEMLLTPEEKTLLEQLRLKETPLFCRYSPSPTSRTLEEVERVLHYLCPDDYDLWLKVGMILHLYFNRSEEALELWNNWSRAADKYQGIDDLREKWGTFTHDKETLVDIGTLFYLAEEQGYMDCVEEVPFQEVEITELPCEPLLFDFSEFEHVSIFDFPTSLLKEVFDYLSKLNKYENSLHPLGAAIAFIGFLMRDQLKSESGLTTNFMVLSIGESGTGKTQTLDGILDLLSYVKQINYHRGRLGTIQGCIEHIHKNGGSLFLVQDEAMFELKSSRNKNVSNSEMRTEEFKLKVFSRPAFYTSDVTKSSELLTVERPFFTEFSVSTFEMFKHFSPSDLTTGLLPRYLFFVPHVLSYKKNPIFDGEIPYSLKEKLIPFQATSTPFCQLAIFNEEAAAYFAKFEDLIEMYLARMRGGSQIKDNICLSPVLARVVAHTWKLSLLGAEKNFTGYTITLPAIRWAVAVSIFCLKNLLTLVSENIFENQTEEYRERVLQKIKEKSKGKWVRKRDLLRSIKFLKLREMDEILSRLLQEEAIEMKQTAKNVFFIRSIGKKKERKETTTSKKER